VIFVGRLYVLERVDRGGLERQKRHVVAALGFFARRSDASPLETSSLRSLEREAGKGWDLGRL
jgi:hypothetical protein